MRYSENFLISLSNLAGLQQHGKALMSYLSLKNSPNEFRPIPLLPILSKIIEKHFHLLITDYICEHSPLSNCQWGFQPRKSTVAALLSTTQDWFQLLEKGKEVGAVFFDFHKAFDTVPHRSLVDKLCQLGLNPQIVNSVHNYLADLKSRVW